MLAGYSVSHWTWYIEVLPSMLLRYGGPGQKSPDYSAFGQITGLCPCRLQAPSATRLAGQPAVQGVIPIFIVGLSVYALF
jgi:hypothetical protein